MQIHPTCGTEAAAVFTFKGKHVPIQTEEQVPSVVLGGVTPSPTMVSSGVRGVVFLLPGVALMEGSHLLFRLLGVGFVSPFLFTS